MQDLSAAFAASIHLIITRDADLLEIVLLSLQTSLAAVMLAAVIGLPLGALLGIARFPGRGVVVATANALMGLPPVVVGLLVYLALSRAGPLGALGLLYTPRAMIIAQTILVTPVVVSITRQIIEDMKAEYEEQLRVFAVGPVSLAATLLRDARYSLIVALMAGFGRAIGEVGAVIVVGGNIDHVTRVMTTAIALETSKGNIPLALGLGLILLTVSLTINIAAAGVHFLATRFAASYRFATL